MFHRKALESLPVSLSLNDWIDLIFGHKQTGKAAVDSLNVFYILTYENTIDLQKIENLQEKNGILDQINEFGQTPRQLFNKPHPLRKKLEKCEALFYDLSSHVKSLNCVNIITFSNNSIVSFSDNSNISNNAIFDDKKLNIYQDFFIEKELSGLNFEKIAGLSTCMKLRATKASKEDLNNIRLYKLGACFFGNTSKTLNHTNCYNEIILSEEKPEENSEIIDVFSLHSLGFSEENLLFSSSNKKYLILGTKNGLIYVYKVIKKKENIRSEITSSCQFHRNSSSSIDNKTFEDRKKVLKNRISFKFAKIEKSSEITKNYEGGEIVLEEKIKCYYPVTRILINHEKWKNIAFMDRGEVIEEIINGEKNSSLLKRNKEKNARKLSCFSNDTKILVEFVSLLKGHFQRITCIRLYEVLFILLTGDEEGMVCLWDLEKGSLNIKIYSYHFIDKEVYKEVCKENAEEFWEVKDKKTGFNKILSRREGVGDLEVCEENGDWCFCSGSYVSVYNINGVLISVVERKREKLCRFTACLLTQVII